MSVPTMLPRERPRLRILSLTSSVSPCSPAKQSTATDAGYERVQGGGAFKEWQPKIISYVSPQLWAWKEGRVKQIAADFDLMLSIFPFEKKWYADRVPEFAVEFVGHPLVDRFPQARPADQAPSSNPDLFTEHPEVLLLPGSLLRPAGDSTRAAREDPPASHASPGHST